VPFDALAAVAVPFALLWVHSLPVATRRSMALAFDDPTLPTLFTAHFVHLSGGHLLSNLIIYALVVPTAYLLARRTDDLRAFRRGFLTVLLVFPPALSGLSVALGRPALGYGFSGLNMALFGLLTMFLGRFLARRLRVGVDRRGLVLFGLGVVLVVLQSLPTTTVTLSVAGAAACLSLASVVGRLRRRSGEGTTFGSRAGRVGDVELAVIAGVLFCALPLLAFSVPASVSAWLGLYVHFLGYALAFTVLYAADASGLLA
jgi:membrane associated rhomboid family serine protease